MCSTFHAVITTVNALKNVFRLTAIHFSVAGIFVNFSSLKPSVTTHIILKDPLIPWRRKNGENCL